VSAAPTVCPKCGQARAAAAAAPQWQCPACGIAYSKFGSRPEESAREAVAPADRRERARTAGERDAAGSNAVGIYLALFVLGFVVAFFTRGGALFWPPLLLAGGAFLLWLAAYRRKRLVEDVPTSTIAAAAQGYVEIQGTVEHAPGDLLAGKLTNLPCVWYHYTLQTDPAERDNSRDDAGWNGTPFIIRDESGECLVDPADAEVICDRCQAWGAAGVTYSEWSIRVGDPIYAIGYFSTGGARNERQLKRKIGGALRSWQRNATAFLARFDADRDGKVAGAEMAAAREAAGHEVLKQYSLQGGVHTLGLSPDGRPFILISADQGRIRRRYRRLTAVHLFIFFASLGALVYGLA
jgi:hypothetical protein